MAITIMIVDDSKLARIVARRHISSLAPTWEQVEAGNAEEAKALVARRQIDVALLDYNMPGETGLELAAALHASHPNMPLAIITANLQDQVVSGARSAGATYVSKPLTEDALRDFVASATLRVQSNQN